MFKSDRRAAPCVVKSSFHSSLNIEHCLLSIFLLLSTAAFAQSPLERKVTLRLDNARLADALNAVARQGDFSFSYASTLFDPDRRVDLVAANVPVRQVLDQLFRGSLQYKSRGNYVILRRTDEEPPRFHVVSGTVTDRRTGERLPQASVYDRRTLTATLTDASGAFRLRLPARAVQADLRVERQWYLPQSLVVRFPDETPRVVGLMPRPVPSPDPLRPLPIRPEPDSARLFETAGLVRAFVSPEQQTLAATVSDTLRRFAQVSFVPYFGTNGSLSGSVVNRFSLNVLAGYSGGVDGLEVGGLLNLVRGPVTGVQVAGFGNLVQGRLRAVQVGGFFNQNFGESHGPQIAGFLNSNWQDAEGVHVAGFLNFSRKNSRAVQVAGFANAVAGAMRGAQVAGFTNFNRGSNEGFQLAGFANLNGQSNRGAQLAGFANATLADNHGFQLAGFANFSGKTQRGWQVAGFLNVARTVLGGHQLGFINVADSSATAPVGFFSYVHQNGYHHLDLSADETVPLNLTFRTGMRAFYTVFTAGFRPRFSGQNLLWRTGFGLGRAWRLSRSGRWGLNSELMAYDVSEPTAPAYGTDAYQLRLLVERDLGRNWSLTLGPTLNVYTRAEGEHRHSPAFAARIPAGLSWKTAYAFAQTTTWIGGQVGVRWRW